MLVVYRHSPAFLTSAVQTKDIFLAVDFFFCLSGFVIAYAYEDRLRTRLRLRDFIVARLIRFYPTFLVGMLLAFLFAIGTGHLLSKPGGWLVAEAAVPSLFFLPSIPLAPGFLLFPLNMSAWTLLNELVMNLGYAVLVRAKKVFNYALAALCLASWLLLVFSRRDLDSGSTWPGALVGFARMGFSFSIGVFVMRVWRSAPLGGIRRTRGLPTVALLVTVMLAVILLPTAFSGQRVYQIFVLTLVLPAIIFFGADIQLGRLGSKACAVLGDLSYPLYIVHLPLLTPLFGSHVARLTHTHPLLRATLAPAYILGLAAASWALRIYFDAPVGLWLTRHYKRYIAAVSRTHTASTQPQASQAQLLRT